jgi:TonB family protein
MPDGLADGVDNAVMAAALGSVGDEVKACLAGRAIQLTATGRVRPVGTVESIVVEPRGPVASCLESAIRKARFAATPGGLAFHRDFNGSLEWPEPHNVAPLELEKYRIKGDRDVVPDDADKLAIQSAARVTGDAGEARLIASLKFCLDRTGKVSHVRQLKSSGYPGYDQKLQDAVAPWLFRPYLVDGKPVPACTAVTFIYKQ